MVEDSVQLPSSYESMYQRAQNLVRSGDLEGALTQLRRIQTRLGSLSEATLAENEPIAQFAYRTGLDLSGLLSGDGRYDEAVEVVGTLHKFMPQEANGLRRRAALILAAKGDLEQAREALTTLAEEESEEPMHLLGLAEVLLAMGDYDGSRKALDAAEPHAGTDVRAALVEHRRFILATLEGSVPQALSAWEAMASKHQAMANWRARELYDFLLAQGQQSALREHLRHDASKARADYFRGLLDHASGDFAAGNARWESLLKTDPTQDPYGATEWGEAALRLGRDREAMTLLFSASEATTSPHTLLLLATGAARSGQGDHALSMLERGARLHRASVPRLEHYSRKDWELFTSLVDNRVLWEAAAPFFAPKDVA